MLLRLFLLFTLLPVIELALLIEVGQHIGTAATIALVLGTGALGAFLARSQGLSVVKRMRQDLNRGQIPAEGLVDGLLILVGGLLLVTPGILSDATGIVLVLPASRRLIKRWLRKKLERWVKQGAFRVYIR